jgi:hypothetical protein
MSKAEPLTFSGIVLRFEPDGFGIVRFDQPLGPSANTYGIISTSTGTTVTYIGSSQDIDRRMASTDGRMINISSAYDVLKPGTHVTGTAEADEKDIASVKTVTVASDH